MALTKFAETVLINTPKMIEFSKRCRKEYRVIIDTESDAIRLKIADNSIDLAVTSPPYVNAVDYPRTHQLEIYWLGMAKGSLTPLKKKHVGTESVCAKDYKILHRIGIEDADIIIEQIFQKDQRRAYIAYKYLMDMKKNLEEVYRVLKKDGYYVIVVGNNKIRGFLFENWRYLMEIAKQIGYRIENYFASEIIKHFIKVPREERINTDWILVLKK
jgi:DNA modification methylase